MPNVEMTDQDHTKERQTQSLRALLIPLSLFLSTLIVSAGGFLIYEGYGLGWPFIAVGGAVMIASFVNFFYFQSKPNK